jgi:hypothetical protein
MKTTATYDSEAGTFTLVRDTWHGIFPISDMPKWLDFYRRQQELFPAYAASYADDIEALEGLARGLNRNDK